jgi:hypothetical protein
LHAATGDLAVAQGSGAGGEPTSGTAGSTLVGYSTADGEERWQAAGDMVSLSDAGVITVLLGPPPTQPPADGSFPMPLMSVTGRDAIDGSELWTADVQSATVINDLAILHTDQTLEAVGVADGQPRWRIPWPADALTPLLGSVSTGDDSVIVIWLPGTDPDAQPTGCD